MGKSKVRCPYNVGMAKSVWVEGFEAGLKFGMRHAGSDAKVPAVGRDVIVEFPERDHKLDAMRGLKEDRYRGH